MSCGSGLTCQSGCYRGEYPIDGEREKRTPVEVEVDRFCCSSPRRDVSTDLCVKCKISETIAVTHPSVGGGGDSVRFCFGCFRSSLYGKFRFAVTSNAMISPSDNVLVAFSGGTSSRVALQFVHEMQQKAQKNYDASRDRSLSVFGVGVAYIDESTIYPIPSDILDSAIGDMKVIVSNLTPPDKRFFIVPTESVYTPDSISGRDMLTKLVASVGDTTGKEDLLNHLRILSLQKVATENGYTKIVLGTCTSRIACHVLEETVKGKGFSLPAGIQYVDARWKIPVLLPLRDCLSVELSMLCTMDSLKTVESIQKPLSGINGLISSFLKLLKEENPSRESTIVRTAGKLTPFTFNSIPVGDDCLASKRRQKKYNLKTDESLAPVSHCIICSSPLKMAENTSLNHAEIYRNTCSSCQYQILPQDPSLMESFVSLLPRSTETGMYISGSQQLLREQIQELLLSDSDGEG